MSGGKGRLPLIGGVFVVIAVIAAVIFSRCSEDSGQEPEPSATPAMKQDVIIAAETDHNGFHGNVETNVDIPEATLDPVSDEDSESGDMFGHLSDVSNRLAGEIERNRERKFDCDMGVGWMPPTTTDMDYDEYQAWAMGSVVFRFYKALSDGNNFVFSPYGGMKYLTMALRAGDGEAVNQIGDWLVRGGSDTTSGGGFFMFRTWYGEFLEKIEAQNELREVSGFWTRRPMEYNARYDFLANTGWYKADTELSQSELLAQVNDYFRENEDRIQFTGSYSDDTYYAWSSTFEVCWPEISECYYTGHDFIEADGTVGSAIYFFPVDAKLYQSETVTAAMAPFEYGHYDFITIMPSGDFSQYVADFTFDDYDVIWKGMSDSDSNVMLPKFAMKREYNVTELLKAAGLTAPFENSGSFPFWCGDSEGFSLGTMLHECYFSLNGRGARTYDTITEQKDASEADFEAVWFDRPFIWLVVDHVMGTPVMMGAVTHVDSPETINEALPSP